MTPQKLTKITRDHAQTVYAWALAEHYRQTEKAAQRKKKREKHFSFNDDGRL